MLVRSHLNNSPCRLSSNRERSSLASFSPKEEEEEEEGQVNCFGEREDGVGEELVIWIERNGIRAPVSPHLGNNVLPKWHLFPLPAHFPVLIVSTDTGIIPAGACPPPLPWWGGGRPFAA